MSIRAEEWKVKNVPQKKMEKAQIITDHFDEILEMLESGYTQVQIAQYLRQVYGAEVLPNDIAMRLYARRKGARTSRVRK